MTLPPVLDTFILLSQGETHKPLISFTHFNYSPYGKSTLPSPTSSPNVERRRPSNLLSSPEEETTPPSTRRFYTHLNPSFTGILILLLSIPTCPHHHNFYPHIIHLPLHHQTPPTPRTVGISPSHTTSPVMLFSSLSVIVSCTANNNYPPFFTRKRFS